MTFAKKGLKNRIYLDHASATPADQSVVRAMTPYWSQAAANPSALHRGGVAAKNALEDARRNVAHILGAHADEIVWTSGGTESDNLAIFGAVRASKQFVSKPHVVTTVIEHAAVLESCRALEREGVSVTYVPVAATGIVSPKDIKAALRPNTVLVSVMYANNEIGTIQPIREIAKEIRHFKKHRTKRPLGQAAQYPLLHTDAVQATNYLDMNVARLGVDMLSLNGSKIYGPKGVGILWKKRLVALEPIMHGGEQEYGLRAGTKNVPLVVGFSKAFSLTERMKTKECARLLKLRDYFFSRIIKEFPSAIINGDTKERLPNNANVSFPGYESDFLIIELDAHGIAVSGKSACKSADGEVSHVLASIRPGVDVTEGSIRFSLGRSTQKTDIDAVIKALKEIFKKQQKWQEK